MPVTKMNMGPQIYASEKSFFGLFSRTKMNVPRFWRYFYSLFHSVGAQIEFGFDWNER